MVKILGQEWTDGFEARGHALNDAGPGNAHVTVKGGKARKCHMKTEIKALKVWGLEVTQGGD